MSKLPTASPNPLNSGKDAGTKSNDAFLTSRLSFDDPKHHIRLYQGDCLEILEHFPNDSVDVVFADPPYFLSNGGITCHAGKMVSVNKGDWDKLPGTDLDPVRVRMDQVHEFNRAWLAACQRVLKPN